eukprot:scaffold25759_cov121-Isochrysis_galbana.AAC.1
MGDTRRSGRKPCPSLCSPGSPGPVPCTWLVQEPPQPRKRPGTHDLPHRQRRSKIRCTYSGAGRPACST